MRISTIFDKQPLLQFVEAPQLVLPSLGMGIEVEVERWDGHRFVVRSDGQGPDNSWLYHADNSLRNNGAEFTCGPVCGGALTSAIHNICEDAKRRGWVASHRCGIHAHMDCTANMDMRGVRDFTALTMILEPAFYNFAGNWRRWCGFCSTFYDAPGQFEELMFALRHDDPGTVVQSVRNLQRYAGLNLASLHKFGTLEMRMFPTTFDEDLILKWINILQSVYAFAQVEGNVTPEFLYAVTGDVNNLRRVFQRDSVWDDISPFIEMKDLKQASVRALLLVGKDVKLVRRAAAEMPGEWRVERVGGRIVNVRGGGPIIKDPLFEQLKNFTISLTTSAKDLAKLYPPNPILQDILAAVPVDAEIKPEAVYLKTEEVRPQRARRVAAPPPPAPAQLWAAGAPAQFDFRAAVDRMVEARIARGGAPGVGQPDWGVGGPPINLFNELDIL